MVLDGLDVIHLAPDPRHAGPQVGSQVIETGVLQLCGGVRDGFQRRLKRFSSTAQDIGPMVDRAN
jgi:hypothetical protein